MKILVIYSDYIQFKEGIKKSLNSALKKYNNKNKYKVQKLLVLKFNQGRFANKISEYGDDMDICVFVTNNICELTIMQYNLKRHPYLVLATYNLQSEFLAQSIDYVQDIVYLRNSIDMMLAKVVYKKKSHMQVKCNA